MWLSLAIAVLSYLLQPRGTSAERKKALVNSLALGAVTYGVQEYTGWGQENLAPLNQAMTPSLLANVPAASSDAAVVVQDGSALPGAPSTGSSSIWSSLASWGPAAAAGLAGGVALGSGSSLTPLLLIGGGLLLLAVLS